MESRTKYAVLIGLGFGIAVLAGLWLAIQVSMGQSLSDLLGIALLGFVLSAFLAGLGAYLYIQADEEPDVIPDVDVRQQRELVDLIHEHGMVSVQDAAKLLQISEPDVKDAVRQLLELGIFTGDVDWETNVLYSQNVKKLN